MTKELKRFRLIALTEGYSYLILLLIAMPLKYWLHFDLAVKFVGWAHGVLFIAYMLSLAEVFFKTPWPFGRVFIAGIASLIPFGTFWIERKYLR